TFQKLHFKQPDLIFTVMQDKKVRKIFKELSKISDSIILTRIGNSREYPLLSLGKLAKRYFKKVSFTYNIKDAFYLAKRKNLVLIGSFYLIGEFLKKCRK
ncbi:MAG: hypothetical protein KKH98_09520, partial [Spirochaetes bacterium]|nr:hypothetical protein [Spirochaetota bacterium]